MNSGQRVADFAYICLSTSQKVKRCSHANFTLCLCLASLEEEDERPTGGAWTVDRMAMDKESCIEGRGIALGIGEALVSSHTHAVSLRDSDTISHTKGAHQR